MGIQRVGRWVAVVGSRARGVWLFFFLSIRILL